MNLKPTHSPWISKPVRRIVALPADPKLRLTTTEQIHGLLRPIFAGLDREHLWRVDLGARSNFLGAELVSIGTVDSAPAHPREIFGTAIAVSRASKIVLAHNHPSGDSQPSDSDLRMTKRLAMCGLLLGIDVVDHIIIANEKHFSFSSARLF